MRFLITGHTGFKGSWLVYMLKMQGHEVHGISLKPERISLFNQANIKKFMDGNYFQDIRDQKKLNKIVRKISPEIIIHLAAQPLVRFSYLDPIGTYETNVLGTLNILESTRKLDNLKATLIITTDKVYKNKNQMTGYSEENELGGEDPYSSSKAAADIATQSWRTSFGRTPISIARAGNVIGGGDWAKDRIIPDLVNNISNNKTLILRNPSAIRPWQHVLDCLNGYLKLIEHQIEFGTNEEWNFGPVEGESKTVEELVKIFSSTWGTSLSTEYQSSNLKESSLLLLDSKKSRDKLQWADKLTFEQSIQWTVDWYKDSNPEIITQKQIRNFLELN